MKDTYRPHTAHIKWLIHDRGRQQSDVAAAIDYNAEHFSRVINGRDAMTFKFGAALAAELGVPWNLVMEAVEPSQEASA